MELRTPPSVLVVDDRDPGGELIDVLLEEALPAGADVRRHTTVQDAIAALQVEPADCVVLDLARPDDHNLGDLEQRLDIALDASMVVLNAGTSGLQDLGKLTGAIRTAVTRRRATRRARALITEHVVTSGASGLIEVDLSDHCHFADGRFCELLGIPRESIRGMSLLDLLHPDDRDVLEGAWFLALEDEGECALELRLVRLGGTAVPVITAWVVIRDPHDRPARWLGAVAPVLAGALELKSVPREPVLNANAEVDFDDNRLPDLAHADQLAAQLADTPEPQASQAAPEVRATDERAPVEVLCRSFVDAPIAAALVGLDGTYVEVNDAFSHLVGCANEELRGRPFESVAHVNDQAACGDGLRALSAGTTAIARWEQRYLHRDGELLWARTHASIVRGADGEALGFILQVEDLADLRAVELELRRQQQDVLAIVAIGRDAVSADDPCTSLCASVRRLLGAHVVSLAVTSGVHTLQVIAEDGLGAPSGAIIGADGKPSAAIACLLTRERVCLADARGDTTAPAEMVAGVDSGTMVFEPIICGTDVLGVLAVAWRSVLPQLGSRRATALRLLAAELAGVLARRNGQPSR